MNTILFDIDGTLMRSGGAGMIAIAQAMQEMFGICEIAKVGVHGRTDQGIFSDLFNAHGLCFDDHRHEFSEQYWRRLPDALASCKGCLLPGVGELLELLSQNDSIALGILTGNARRPAEIKLEHFGLASYFGFGGYGDTNACRNEVARLAYESAVSYLGNEFDSDRLWVIGDTVNDITCARSIGSKVVAVETGGCAPEVLADANPDIQLEGLNDIEAFVSLVLGGD